MVRLDRDFLRRPESERRFILGNSWCDNCSEADIGMVDPCEFEEDGKVIVEGKCIRCHTEVRSEVKEG